MRARKLTAALAAVHQPARRFHRWGAVVVTAALVAAYPMSALADDVDVDDVAVIEGPGNVIDFGDVCVDDTATKDIYTAARRTGGAASQTWANGSTITVSIAGKVGAGLSAAMGGNPGDTTINLPVDWSDVANNDYSVDTARAVATLDATGLPVGAYGSTNAASPDAKKIIVRATGLNAASPAASKTDTDEALVVANVLPLTHADCTTNTEPVVTFPTKPGATVEGNTTGGATVAWTVNVTDAEDGTPPTASCHEGGTPMTSGDFFSLGAHTVTCSATDLGGLTGTSSFSFTVVDTTAPVLTVPANISQTATSQAGNAVTWSVSAIDVVDSSPDIVCTDTSTTGNPVISSGATLLGTHVISCTATDDSQNTDTEQFTISVLFDFQGFFAPVDNKVLNGMKAGSTAPIKFRIGDGTSTGLMRDVSLVAQTLSGSFVCSATGPVDNLETYATGSTVLRYDDVADQFVYNWKAPKAPGACYRVKIVLADGIAHTADFTLR